MSTEKNQITISDAIHAAEEREKEFRNKADEILTHSGSECALIQVELNIQYAEEQKQIRGWLKELQKIRWYNHMDTE